ncbi:phosphotransferase [Bacillus rubiinfantis]|uniref:phosphotransferase n=1 Tax=Bacillus rubiinfantis TaxID=1499680 RepID=UPI0005A7C2FD|nr:phosphotransferase [Bacillus rubiinfantis]
MSKAVKAAGLHGDDAYFDRLFSYFQSHLDEPVLELRALERSVLLLKTNRQAYIVKGYSSIRKLKIQEAFTATLKKEGFPHTYVFLQPSAKDQLFFEGNYLGFMEYIPQHRTTFSFQTNDNRREGLELLQQFHHVTGSFETRYKRLLPKANLLGKWVERYKLFFSNYLFLKHFLSESFLSDLNSWAAWSLRGMETNALFFQKGPVVILHGDVAHHNFLRSKHGKLYLIDFDLINIGPAVIDYIQYANRILPHLDWSVEKLLNLQQMKTYENDKAFLYALTYPADIFREWNRVVREKSYFDQYKIQQVIDLTVRQFYARKNFIKQIKRIVS